MRTIVPDGVFGTQYHPRRQQLIRYHADELLRERIFSRALGYNVEDEADPIVSKISNVSQVGATTLF